MANKHAIRGKIELENGLILAWLQFVYAETREAAEAEAIRILCAHWKGVTVRCWVV